jgi:hypothetical protein
MKDQKMKIITALLFVMALLTSCTPGQIQDWYASTGTEISDEQAKELAVWINEQDCLPNYDSGQYVECAIRDSWHAYDVPVSLDTWAQIAWCESNHQPDAKNPSSSASGLYQNLARYWDGRAEAAGFPGGDIWNARVHAFVSAHLAETSGVDHWSPSAHCW